MPQAESVVASGCSTIVSRNWLHAPTEDSTQCTQMVYGISMSIAAQNL
jgi:hypothetical protein